MKGALFLLRESFRRYLGCNFSASIDLQKVLCAFYSYGIYYSSGHTKLHYDDDGEHSTRSSIVTQSVTKSSFFGIRIMLCCEHLIYTLAAQFRDIINAHPPYESIARDWQC